MMASEIFEVDRIVMRTCAKAGRMIPGPVHLLYATLVIALAACTGQAASSVDLEATVDARVAQELARQVPRGHDHDHDHNSDTDAQQSRIAATDTSREKVPAQPDNSLLKSANDSPGQDTITVSEFTILSKICADEHGPDCSMLRLGDDYLTTSMPAKGYLYSCQGKNPSAPGADSSKAFWIDFVDQTWNFFEKIWLPEGDFRPQPGLYEEILSGGERQIRVNNLPVDRMIGDWPMTDYTRLTTIDRNPGIPVADDLLFSYPVTPTRASSPSCVSLGSIGVTKNGVIIYNAADARGEDAVAHEIVDEYGGHPARDSYHYHFIPERIDNDIMVDGHSGIVGYINDGFPIYGYRGIGGIEMSNDDLDECHGHFHGALGYHYHATIEYPYTVGCYVGTPAATQPRQGGPQDRDMQPRQGGQQDRLVRRGQRSGGQMR